MWVQWTYRCKKENLVGAIWGLLDWQLAALISWDQCQLLLGVGSWLYMDYIDSVTSLCKKTKSDKKKQKNINNYPKSAACAAQSNVKYVFISWTQIILSMQLWIYTNYNPTLFFF